MNLISRLSMAALQYVEAFESDDQDFMAERFYAYNTFPATRAWGARLASRPDTAAYIGIARHPVLRREWVPVNLRSDSWFAWRRRFEVGSAAAPRFKLYVSPHHNDVPDVFASIAHVFTEEGAVTFKVGNNLSGLLRPDKMVGFFADFAALVRAAGALGERVACAKAHGVPFSCQLDGAGLLSWGLDPLQSEGASDGLPSSWRLWLSARLAALFLEARKLGIGDVTNYALEHLSADGVDVHSWVLRDFASAIA
jgi:hypothetical protein